MSELDWEEALDTIAARFRGIADSADGPQAILPYSYAGTMGKLQGSSLDRRFFHRLGASLLDRTICASAGAAGLKATVGKSMGFDPEAIVNAMVAAEDMVGVDGHKVYAIPHQRLRDVLRKYNRLVEPARPPGM